MKKILSFTLCIVMLFVLVCGSFSVSAVSTPVSAKEYLSDLDGIKFVRIYKELDDLTDKNYILTGGCVEMYDAFPRF